MPIKCPFCRNILDDSDDYYSIGDFIYCSSCDKDFEVVKLRPLRLHALSMQEQDNDYYNDEGY